MQPHPHANLPESRIALAEPWRELWHYHSIDSTQRLAAELVQSGGDMHGIVILADEQTLGRGRSGNEWSSEAGGLYVTAGLPGQRLLDARLIGWVPLAAAVSCIETLRELYNLALNLKWPNDVLLDGSKLAGVLGEFVRPKAAAAKTPGQLLIGMGLNWRNRVPSGALSVGSRAIGLLDQMPAISDEDRFTFINLWLERLAWHYERLLENPADASAALVRLVEPILWRRGESVRLERTEQGTIAGQLIGLGELGAARVRLDDGRLIDVHCGWQHEHRQGEA